MPDTLPEGAPAPIATPAPSAPVVATPAPAAVTAPAATPAASNEPPAWLPERLERAAAAARSAVLAELGVANADEAKAAVEAARAAADAKKSAEERAAELLTSNAALKTTAEKQAAAAKEMAGRMLMALAPEQRDAVTAFAGDDPIRQFEAIKHFGPTWALAEQAKDAAAKAVADAAAALKAAPPATTSPAPAAPSSEAPASPESPKSVYETTRSTNPFKAAAYGLSNPTVYDSK